MATQKQLWSVTKTARPAFKRWVVSFLALTLAACSLPEAPRSANDVPLTPPTTTQSEMLEQVNVARAAGQDCGAKGTFAPTGALTLEPHLNAAAQGHADDMNAQDYFSHTGQDGSTVGTRVSGTGYSWSQVGENIAYGYKSTAEVVAGWLASDGHCANLMKPGYTALGVGKSGEYWVQVFARAK